MMLHPTPAIGGPLVTIKKTEEVVRWTSFDDKNQILTVILPNGEIGEIHKRETRLATTEENVEFRKKNPTVEIG